MAGPHCSVALLDRLGVVSVHDASCQRRDPQMFLSWQIPVDASPISRMRCRLPLMADGRWWMATQGTKRRPYQQRADMCWRVIGLAARDEMNWNPGRLFSSVNSSNSSDGHDGIRGRDPGWAIGCVAIGSVAVGRSATSNQVRGECCSGTQPASTKHRRLQFLQWALGRTGLDAPRSSCDGASARRGSAEGGDGLGMADSLKRFATRKCYGASRWSVILCCGFLGGQATLPDRIPANANGGSVCRC